MKRYRLIASLVFIVSMFIAGCNSSDEKKSTSTPTDDQLSEILKRGTLIIATDPAYAPQSQLIEGVDRATDTLCGEDQTPANQLEGFDIEVAKEISQRLGVEPCFVFPAWTLIIGGSWADKWDISIGSMAITPERINLLYFPQPYYITPTAFFVREDETAFTEPADLSGKKIGTCTGCTYEAYLNQTLTIPGQTIDFLVDDAEVVGYEVENPAFEALVAGDLDAVISAVPTGLSMMASDMALKQLGEPVFNEYLATAIDKKMSKSPVSFYQRTSAIIQEMHSDGTLLALSQQFYDQDYATAAQEFDVKGLNQQ